MITVHMRSGKEAVFHDNEYTSYEFVTDSDFDPMTVRFNVYKCGVPVGLFFLSDDEYVHIKEDDNDRT